MRILITLCLFWMAGNVLAQSFTNYTNVDGIAHENVLCLAVAGNDVLWFGTQMGVSKFDGQNWTTYLVAMDSGLVDNTITALAVDDYAGVWVGTDFGASYYDGNSWTPYTEADGLGDNRVKDIFIHPDGSVWFGTNDGVSILILGVWASYGTSDGLPFGGVNSIALAGNGDVWLGTGLGGVSIFDGTNFTSITEDDGLLNDKVRAVAIDAEQRKWVGTSDGVSVFDVSNNLEIGRASCRERV